MRRLLSVVLFALVTLSGVSLAGEARPRVVAVKYIVTIDAVPDGARKIAIWLPNPEPTPLQATNSPTIRGDLLTRKVRDARYGTPLLLGMGKIPEERPFFIAMAFEIQRQAQTSRTIPKKRPKLKQSKRDRWLVIDGGVDVDPALRESVAAIESEVDRLQAIKDALIGASSSASRDIVQQFVNACRSVAIPARQILGFHLPETRGKGAFEARASWPEVFLGDSGWTAVNLESTGEGSTLFALDDNRVELTMGRGLQLDPAAATDPDSMLFPYVEIDGKPFSEFGYAVAYEDRETATGDAIE